MVWKPLFLAVFSMQFEVILGGNPAWKEARVFENAPSGTKVTLHKDFGTAMSGHRGCYTTVLGRKVRPVPFAWDREKWTLVSFGEIIQPIGSYYAVTLGYFCAGGRKGRYSIIVRVSKKNKHRPRFDYRHRKFFVPESVNRDYSVFGNLAAHDRDPVIYNSRVAYSMVGNFAHLFRLHKNGSLSLRPGSVLTDKTKYLLVVKACDYGSPQKCSTMDLSIIVVSLTGPRNVEINIATLEYQVITWREPKYGTPLIYSVHIVPEIVYKNSVKTYQRTVVHHPGKQYSVLTRRKLKPKSIYYVMVYANDGVENTPSDVQVIHMPSANVSCDGVCGFGGHPVCYKDNKGAYEQLVEDIPQCICYPGYTGDQCSETDFCPTERSETRIGWIIWSKTEINTTASAQCPFGPPENVLSRPCSLGEDDRPAWGDIASNGTDGCQSKGRLLTTLAMHNVMLLRNGTLTKGQLHQLADTLEPLLPAAYADHEVAQSLINLIGEVVGRQWVDFAEANHMKNRFRSIIVSFAENANLSDNMNSFTLPTDNIVVSVLDLRRDQQIPKHFQLGLGEAGFIEVSLDALAIGLIQSGENTSRFRAIWMRNSTLYPSAKTISDSSNSVVEIGFRNVESVAGFRSPIRYRMKKYHHAENNSYSCVYYISGEQRWSADGVITISDFGDPDSVTCKSYHMTGFSILLDFDGSGTVGSGDRFILNILSWTGCSVSIVGLALTILTYCLFRCLNRDYAGQILISLCSAMLLLNAFFLVSSVRPYAVYSRGFCSFVGACLHYFTLSALLWMGVEAANMYNMLVRVFVTVESWFLLKRSLLAWGVPLVIVGVTVSVNVDFYHDQSDDYCRLSTAYGFVHYGSYLGPACLILLANTVVFILVIRVLARSTNPSIRKASSAAEVSGNNKKFLKNNPIAVQVRGALTVMVLLGITWVFGVFAVGPARLPFMYIFCILNSLQGFIIFLVRCLFFDEARVAWELLLKTGNLKKHRGKVVTGSLGATTNASGGGEVVSPQKSIPEIHQKSVEGAQSDSTEPLLLVPKRTIREEENEGKESSAGRRIMLRLTSWKYVDDPPSPLKPNI